MLGSLVKNETHGDDVEFVERVLKACNRVIADSSYGMDVCMEGLNTCCIAMSVNPGVLCPLNDGRDVGECVTRLLTGMDEGVCVEGYVRALGAHPVATLRTLGNLLTDSKITKERGKACLMACMDHAYRYVAEHEPGIGIPYQGMTSVMEQVFGRLQGHFLVECQNIVQEIMGLVPLEAGQGERIREVMARVGCLDTVSPSHDGMMMKDMEEGELFIQNAPDDARMMIEDIVPVRVSKTLKVYDLPETVSCDALRDACDAFTGIQAVTRDEADVYITCTSMPGVARCYEAIYTRGAEFWSSVGFDGVPQVDLCSVESSSCIFMQGVKDVEHEDAIARVLEQGGIESPSSLLSLHVGIPGVILCFERAEDADDAYRYLGGVDGKRERDEVSPDDHERKKARTMVQQEEEAWSGRVLRNKQLQCAVYARPLKDTTNGTKKDEDGHVGIDWPEDIEVNQRVDVQYVCGTLVSSVPKDAVNVFIVYPQRGEENEKGLVGFDAYLRGKGRAGVASLTPLDGMQKRTLYLIPISDHVCYTLGIDSKELPRVAILGMVVEQ